MFDEIKWLCVFAKYTTLKFITEPQSLYVNKLILTPFSPFGIECKKLIAENLWKCIFRASRRATFSYFSTRSWEVTPTTPFRIFVDYVAIFNAIPMQNLRWDSL